MGLYVRGRSSSPRCIAHCAQCLVTHVVHNICDQEAELVRVYVCAHVHVCASACLLCVCVHVHGVCPQCVRRLCLNVGCEMKHYSALQSLFKCQGRVYNTKSVPTSFSLRIDVRYKIMLFWLCDKCTMVTSASH